MANLNANKFAELRQYKLDTGHFNWTYNYHIITMRCQSYIFDLQSYFLITFQASQIDKDSNEYQLEKLPQSSAHSVCYLEC